MALLLWAFILIGNAAAIVAPFGDDRRWNLGHGVRSIPVARRFSIDTNVKLFPA
jgi:hypothetical protein